MKYKVFLFIALFFTSNAKADFSFTATDFKFLYNHYRFAQVRELPWPGTYWPYDGENAGSGINHVPTGEQLSPAQKYDAFFDTKGAAAKWEEANHSCAGSTGDQLKDCKEWYGHCNGWSGAALYTPEPSYDKPVTVTNPKTGVTMSFNYMDIKALLSEAWLDAWVSFEGVGTSVEGGDWIFDPNSQISKQASANNSDVTNYEAYWDVTPRAFFHILTNNIGIQHVGIAIDRFTGSEIWNQPVVGYRILPIQGNTDHPIERDGQKVYPVTVGVKIYWANDELDYTFKRTASLGWDISDAKFSNDRVPSPPADQASQDSVEDKAIVSRYMSFTLFFDAPVEVSDDGTKVFAAGKILGDGVWTHSDPAQKAVWFPKDAEKSQTHPDFIWRPDYLTATSFRNPAIDPKKLYQYILQKPMGEVGRKLR